MSIPSTKGYNTIHLQYNTLKNVLDKMESRYNENEYNKRKKIRDQIVCNEILFVKKINISNIVTFLPTDICTIINKYCYKKIVLMCYIHPFKITKHGIDGDYNHVNNILKCSYDEKIEFELNTMTNKIRILPSSSCIQLIECFKAIHHDARPFLNKFMEYNYGKHNYIDCSISEKLTYYRYPSVIKNTILANINQIIGIKILDCKKFKYVIVMLKCLISGINKYEKTETNE